jgi:hypothetical protein
MNHSAATNFFLWRVSRLPSGDLTSIVETQNCGFLAEERRPPATNRFNENFNPKNLMNAIFMPAMAMVLVKFDEDFQGFVTIRPSV